ncbi:MAG: alpha/beta hydrolase [Limnohabitans sp.]|nr:alpha/beta hydrolase [Limnohabitans sp.]
MTRRIITHSFFYIALLFIACKKDSASSSNNTVQMMDVAYGTDPAMTMDVYLPAERSTTATSGLVIIHGGSWVNGDKADMNAYLAELRNRLPSYAIFNINYRLATISGFNLWPTAINDVNAAINFIQTKSAEYKFNGSKLGLIGASAGAHLALLSGYQNNTGNRVKAIIDLFGPTDMLDLYNRPADANTTLFLNLFLQGTPSTNSTLYRSASPLYSVSASVPPTIIFHGGLDNTVHIRQSDSLNNRLTNAGVKKQYIVYPTEAHGWIGTNLLDTYNKMTAFITENVK